MGFESPLRLRLTVMLLMLLPGILLAQTATAAPAPASAVETPGTSNESGGISATLFEHILNSDHLSLFPYLPPVPLPFGLTVHLFIMILAVLGIAVSFILAVRKKSLKPRGLAMAAEMIVLFVRDDIVYPTLGEKRGRTWLPFFATLFLFILVMNMLGLIPAFKTPTGNISVTAALALVILVLTFAVGLGRLGFGGFFRNFYPSGSPVAIGLFVALLEFLGILIKGVVLCLRLFANMFAGHLAILSFLVLIFILGPFMSILAVPFALFIYALEVLIALIQAYVFTLLSCIFIQMASTSHDAEHE